MSQMGKTGVAVPVRELRERLSCGVSASSEHVVCTGLKSPASPSLLLSLGMLLLVCAKEVLNGDERLCKRAPDNFFLHPTEREMVPGRAQEVFTSSGTRLGTCLKKKISLGWLYPSLQSEPHACWKEVLFAGPERVKHNLRAGLEPNSPTMLWQVAHKAAELQPAPLVLKAPPHLRSSPLKSVAPAPRRQPSGQWVDAMPVPKGSPGRSSSLQRLRQLMLGGRASCVCLLWALKTHWSIWSSHCWGQDIAAGDIGASPPAGSCAVWMCNAHRHGIYCAECVTGCRIYLGVEGEMNLCRFPLG